MGAADYLRVRSRDRERVHYYYYSSSSNLRAHGVCDYGTLPVMWQDLTSYLTTYIYKYIRPFRIIFLPYHRQTIHSVDELTPLRGDRDEYSFLIE